GMGELVGMTPLAVSALALLEERPMHPYEMLQLLRVRAKAEMITVKAGSLYHTMSRLVDHGLAEIHGTERDGNRPERTVYRLTDAGRRCYVAWVRSRLLEPATPQEYAVALGEAHNLAVDEVATILRSRRDELAALADELRTGLADARARNVPDAYVLEHLRRLALLDCDIAWTDDTVRRLSTRDISWTREADRGTADQTTADKTATHHDTADHDTADHDTADHRTADHRTADHDAAGRGTAADRNRKEISA
ncbi:MAG: PadR family transcriptional regulator, partial [Leifsonia sp.]